MTLSIKAREVEDEKKAMAEYGSTDSGATLGDILGAALAGTQDAAEPALEAEAEKPKKAAPKKKAEKPKKAAPKKKAAKAEEPAEVEAADGDAEKSED